MTTEPRYIKMTQLKDYRPRPAVSTMRRLHTEGKTGSVVAWVDNVLTTDWVREAGFRISPVLWLGGVA